ncbi:MAG: rod shape-determining protein RodA [Minisyncoccota bacterium]
MEFIEKAAKTHIDWILFFALLPLLGAGLVTMDSFREANTLFYHQLVWIGITMAVFFGVSFFDLRFLKRTKVLVWIYGVACFILLILFVLGHTAKGATSWFRLGGFSFEPADPMKLVIILVLSKYFSRRHVEIAHFKHIIVSGVYALIPFILILLQPDFGSALIIFFIWFGMIMVSGISRKHLATVFAIGALAFGALWNFGFHEYQKARIVNFLHPLANIHGSGWNAYQSTIAVGSGEVWGKGVGYGTQSRLKFLPEYQTDFIFAAFAEEWGFAGVMILFLLFGILMWRILANALVGAGNFEMLFGMGLAIFLMAHFVINIGMNMGLMPVTGITAPFLSYGGSHLLTEFLGLGILMSFRRYSRAAHRDDMKNEFFGV